MDYNVKNPTLVTSIAFSGYRHVFKQCIESQRRYCASKNYDYFLLDRQPWNLSANDAAWTKVKLLLHAANAGYEQILFLDADCEVRSHTPPISEIIENGKYLYLAPGKSGRINSGVILMLHSTEAISFMQMLLRNAHKSVPERDAAPYENGHFIHYTRGLQWIGRLSHEKWNNNSYIDKDSFVQHYSGGPLRTYYKTHNLSSWLNFCARVDNSLSKLNRPPKEFQLDIEMESRLERILNAVSVDFSNTTKRSESNVIVGL